MIAADLLAILVCPEDRGPLLVVQRSVGPALYNPRLRRAYRIDDGIPVLLIDEAESVDDAEHTQIMGQADPSDRP